MSKKITILGAGCWGTAVATLLAANGHNVTLWCFEQSVVDDISENSLNKKYFPGFELPDNITPTSSLHEAIDGADFLFEAVPVLFLRDVLQQAKKYVTKEQKWVMLSKGIDESGAFSSQILESVLGYTPNAAVFSGPNFAKQLAEKKLTATVVASKNESLAREIRSLCLNDYFKVDISSDIIGTQVGGALKNVISLFLGILDGAGYEENTRAFFLTRGVEEMARFAEYSKGKKETVYGLAGLGDLALGLIGKRNRNYNFGVLFGKGSSLKEISEMMDVLPEGVNTVKSIHNILKREKIDLPICSGVYDIVYGGRSIREFVQVS